MPTMVSQSPAFRSVRALLLRYARSDAQVLIEGETGTGKELAVREIHYSSLHRDQPFAPVNCGAMQDSLTENELFGHSKGAFTDTRRAQVGPVEHARGGCVKDDTSTLDAAPAIARNRSQNPNRNRNRNIDEARHRLTSIAEVPRGYRCPCICHP